MLINFIGCPQSGKTTTAAQLFSTMKETGMVAEFTPEQARFYIARERVGQQLQPSDKLTLSDEDQYNIMYKQVETDIILSRACGPDVFIISDSSALNALLYMSPEARTSKHVQQLVSMTLSLKPITFYAHPIYRPYQQDPNRIHSEEQARVIDSQIQPILSELAPDLQMIPIHGTTTERLLIVQNRIFFSSTT